MKYSKNGQNFALSKNTSDMLFKTWKKLHFSTWSRSSYTFFLITPYIVVLIIGSVVLHDSVLYIISFALP